MILADHNSCTACMACVDSCPNGVLNMKLDKNGYYIVSINKDIKCLDCGKCSRVCPVLNKFKYTGRHQSQFYAGWNTNLEDRKKSASGGAFSAIATTFLQNNGIVYGASIKGFDVVHIRVSSITDLYLLLGTKYQSSNLAQIYKQVRKDLKTGYTVLFSGLGCQIAGLLSFLSGVNTDNLYTIDMICGGISTILPMLQIKKSNLYTGIKSFRDKDNGWSSFGFKYNLKMIKNNGEIESCGDDNLVLKSFSSYLLKRPSCYDCHFKGFNRISDCTIGDFWGDRNFECEHRDGLSLVIIHSHKMLDIIHKSNLKLLPTAIKSAIEKNPNIYFSNYRIIKFLPSRAILLFLLRLNKNMLAYKLLCNTRLLVDYKLALCYTYKNIRKSINKV